MPTSPYYTSSGKRVPGVTTVTGMFDGGKSRALMAWAAGLAEKGQDWKSHRDEAALIGTAAHAIVMAELVGRRPDLEALELAPEQLAQAENAALSAYAWLAGRKLEPVLVEQALVSDEREFGGTPDIFGLLDGVPTLIDLKTSKSILVWTRGVPHLKAEYALQVGGYALLLEEAGHAVERVLVLRVTKTEDEVHEHHVVEDLEACKQGFLACLQLYRLQKRLG